MTIVVQILLEITLKLNGCSISISRTDLESLWKYVPEIH